VLAEEKQLLLFLHSAGGQNLRVAAEGTSGDTRFHSAGQPSNTSIPETFNDLVDAGEAAVAREAAAAMSTQGLETTAQQPNPRPNSGYYGAYAYGSKWQA
jgi:hypothetical protein